MAETEVFEKDHVVNLDKYTGKLFKVVSFLRIDFLYPEGWTTGKRFNALLTSILFCIACYSAIYTTYVILSRFHAHNTLMEMSTYLLILAWAIQAIVSMAFLVYWQLYGHLKSFHRHIMDCQNGAGLAHGKSTLTKNVCIFYVVLVVEIVIYAAFEAGYYMETNHSPFAKQTAVMFYFTELRVISSVCTLYIYIIWNISMFLYMIYTNAAYVEARYFNQMVEKFDGSHDDACNQLLRLMEVYGRLIAVIRELDRIFRLYAFIMLVIIVPSVIFTLMMINQRIHGFKDFLICLPSVALCIYSFLGVTIAPARLHDEICRSKMCLVLNKSIWYPYRPDVYNIASTLSIHMDHFDLGISIWGFAVLSRPLILATFSVMAMMFSVLVEISPQPYSPLDTHTNH